MRNSKESFIGKGGKPDRLAINLSARSLVVTVVGSIAFAFALGLHAREIVSFNSGSLLSKRESGHRYSVTLPDLPLLLGKAVPSNAYTSKYFSSGVKVRSSSALLKDERIDECELDAFGDLHCETATKLTPSTPNEYTTDDSAQVHHPSGQHLLVDIEKVQTAFLNSEEQLAAAMIDVIQQSELTLLSYHCHGLAPTGVSCVGVLLDGHVSFQTWPDEGVITMDLFSCGSMSLVPLVNAMFKLFGIPRNTGEEPNMQWSHKKRGFRSNANVVSDHDRFLALTGLGKEEIASVTTDLQTMHVYDTIEPRFRGLESHKLSLSNDGVSYESLHPELFQKDRLVFLDGVLQSRRYGESAYHEALVHPAMTTHKMPKRIVVVGGGEGAVLREVLKHSTVEKVVFLEVDDKVTQVSREHLREWSDCRNLVGGTASCFDDPRVKMYHVDAVDWFTEHFSEEAAISESDQYDVVLIDAL
jgi:S-adenosylmethionine/arginine decarboxylase-like enzyme